MQVNRSLLYPAVIFLLVIGVSASAWQLAYEQVDLTMTLNSDTSVDVVQSQRAGCLIMRAIGMTRAAAKVGLRNLAYNIDRFSLLATA